MVVTMQETFAGIRVDQSVRAVKPSEKQEFKRKQSNAILGNDAH